MICFGAPNSYPYAVNTNTDSYNPRPNMDMIALELTGEHNCLVFDDQERLTRLVKKQRKRKGYPDCGVMSSVSEADMERIIMENPNLVDHDFNQKVHDLYCQLGINPSSKETSHAQDHLD